MNNAINEFRSPIQDKGSKSPDPDKAAMLSAISVMFDPSDVVELRAFHKGKKRTDAGYFDGEHRQELVDAAARLNKGDAAVYVTLNQIDPQLLARYCNRVEQFAAATVTDANVIRRRWLLIDFDPVRPKDTSAIDAQLEAAHQKARQCATALKDAGWPDPIAGQSGNGWHLLYPLDLPNDNESRDLVKAALAGLAARFDDAVVTVDQSVFNAGRITKLFGTVATKGDHTPMAPWRLSRLELTPKREDVVSADQLRALHLQQAPEQPAPTTRANFDLSGFLLRLNIAYDQDQHEGRERYKLEFCPFNADHGKGEAAVFRSLDGKLGFKCQHNGCADKHWEDVRALLDGPRDAREQHRTRASGHARAEYQPDAENGPAGDTVNGIKDDKDDKNDKPTTAKALIDIAVKNCDLFHDERGDGYAVTMHNGIRRTLKLRGRDFRRWLAGTYYAATQRAANSEAVSTAMSVLEAKATFDGKQLELSNRFALRDGVIYIDMADAKWRVVKITAMGWEVMDKAPVLFRRYSHQQALPDPVRGGKLASIHKHLAIKTDGNKLLLEAWLVASVFSSVPRPAITFHGPQGGTKSTSARVLKAITDPSLTESVDLGKSPADLAQVLDHNGVPCFDNLTSIQTWAADMLCRAVTGGAFTKRELFSDEGDILLTFKRPIIITGINIPTHAPDLLDRLLLIELERIQSENRIDEATFWGRFNAERPKLFGALLDAIAGTLKHLPNVKLNKLPRMADFAKVACAYAEYSGFGADNMLDVIMANSSRQTEEILDADPVASAIRDFIQKRGTWTGTAGELLKLLNAVAPTPRADGWPKQSNFLSRKLNILHATLNDVGISVRRERDGAKRDRKITLEIRPDSSSASSASSSAMNSKGFNADDTRDDILTPDDISSASSSAENDSDINDLGDTDDQDDISVLFSSDGHFDESPIVEVEV